MGVEIIQSKQHIFKYESFYVVSRIVLCCQCTWRCWDTQESHAVSHTFFSFEWRLFSGTCLLCFT